MWQLAIAFYFLFGTASYLLRRVLAQQLGDYNRLISAIFFVFFLLPATLILFPFFPHNLAIGTTNLLLLLSGSLIWPVLTLISFKANQETEVGIFVIINNLSPLFTLLIALPFLHESVSSWQFVGIGLLIFSGILAASSQRKDAGKLNVRGLLWCLLSAVILGLAVAYEGFMLDRVDLGTYLLYGWTAQVFWAALFAASEFKRLPALFSKGKETTRTLLLWGLTSVLRSMAFILALKISSSASIISAASDFLSVAVVVAAYFYLKERDHIVHKMIAVIAGALGLLLIAL